MRFLRCLWVLFLTSLSLLVNSGCRHPRSWQVVPDPPSIATPQKDFTLVWDKKDANLIPLDPYWGLEKIQNEIPPREQSSRPYPCELDPFASHCTENQGLVQDLPQFPNSLICEVGNLQAKIHGHADWIVTSQQGCVSWENQSADGDYNFRLFPFDPHRSGLTKNNDNFIGLEFDFYETLQNAQLPVWQQLNAEVERENNDTRSHEDEIRKILHRVGPPDDNPRAVTLGLFGVDCEHGCKSEVHPVLAFAVEINPDPADDTWVLFVRNWGSQGYCSRYRHLVDFFSNQVSILLFDDQDSDGPTVIPEQTRMFASQGSNLSFPTFSYWQGHGPVVTFNFPAPEQAQVMAEMEIHYRWNRFKMPFCKQPVALLAARPAASLAPQNAEGYLESLQRNLRKKKPTAMANMLEARAKNAFHMSEVKKPSSFAVSAFTPPPAPAKRVQTPPKLPKDTGKSRRDLQQVQTLCTEYNNHLPPFQGKDLSSKLCNQAKLAKELQKVK